MDAVYPTLVDQAETALTKTPGVVGVDQVRLRWIGHRMHVEATVTLDLTLDVVAPTPSLTPPNTSCHQVPRLDDATVHINPAPRPGVDDHTLTGHHQH